MKRYTAIIVALCVTAFATSCAAPQQMMAPLSLTSVQPLSSSSNFTIVHNFGTGYERGTRPTANVIAFAGKDIVYGTTARGGKGHGTIYSLTAGGKYRVLHEFLGGTTDGSYPNTSLTKVGDVLYGTTTRGGGTGCANTDGPKGCGTIFSISPDGSNYNVLYKFTGGSDGRYPIANLLLVEGTLYGTTFGFITNECYSSDESCGTVFSYSASAGFKTLHMFTHTPDGSGPVGTLAAVGGKIYGVTAYGGTGSCGAVGCGTIYSVTPSGAEQVVHSFTGGKDCSYPQGGVTLLHGTLYGSAFHGCSQGSGARYGGVFSVTAGGKEKVVYGFTGGRGLYPQSPLTAYGGVLYGLTDAGGTYGTGTAFSLTTSGKLQTLHSFELKRNFGAGLGAALTYFNHAFYGVLAKGGSHNEGAIYALTP